MTAILRIREDGDLKYEIALRGVERVGGVMFYEMDLSEIQGLPEPDTLTKHDRVAARLRRLHAHDPTRRTDGPDPADFPYEAIP